MPFRLRTSGGESSGFMNLPGFTNPIRQSTSDLLMCSRNLAPVVSNTPSTCRSTYLLRLNSTNKYIAAAHGDKSVSIYCAVNSRLVARCIGHDRSPWTITFHPTRPYLLASGCLGGDVRIWNLEPLTTMEKNANEPMTILCQRRWKHAGAIASVTFHPVDPILSVAWTQEVVFYDWISGNKLSVWRFVSEYSRVRWVSYSPGGELLYTATGNPSSSTQPLSGNQTPSNNCNPSDVMIAQTTSLYAGSPIPSNISRNSLLLFLLWRPNSWFTGLGVCDNCSIRLCRWAGALDPKFPAPIVDIHRGMQNASQMAVVTARNMQFVGDEVPHVVQSLLSDASHRLRLDAHPTAVVIIEDKPVKEFLLSRGPYCSSPCVALQGVCCGSHASDLLVTQRDLMKHSICRACLNAFWGWASRNVNWWCWSSEPEVNTSEPLNQNHSFSPNLQIDRSNGVESPNTHLPCESPVGICINCQACMNNKSNSTTVGDVTGVCHSTRSSINQSNKSNSLHIAGLELLRSRLSNANEVTPLTYLASDLIAEGALTDFIRSSLLSNRSDSTPLTLPRSIAHLLCGSMDLSGSPLSKRRKLADSPSNSSEYSSNSDSDSSDSSISDSIDWTEEAANLGRWMNNNPSQSWNFPRSVHLQRGSPDTDNIVTNLFPYVSLGSHLLLHPGCPITESNDVHSTLTSRSAMSCRPNTSTSQTLTACCRCGQIVLKTFPVDPQSHLSAVVCERFVLPDGQQNSKPKGSPSKTVIHTQTATIITLDESNTRTSPSDTSRHNNNNNNTMYVINQTGGDTVLNSVNRTITEVIAGVFVDMGEHSSAAGLQTSTHRVCCWQLNVQRTLPMPTNTTVSYNTNSLVIPYARLFNDSSICLSPDGRTIATFVTQDPLGVDGFLPQTPTDSSSSHSDTILVVYRLQPKSFRGDCLFSHRFTDSYPVCLDFSPSGNYLVVGMATTRFPCVKPLPSLNRSDLTFRVGRIPPSTVTSTEAQLSIDVNQNDSFVAKIFRLERVWNKDKSVVDRSVREVSKILHPTFLNPRSSLVDELYPGKLSDGLDNWHRVLLSRSARLSLNTILWNPRGGLMYGTTKGLIVNMVVQPYENDSSFPALLTSHHNTINDIGVRIDSEGVRSPN